MPPKMRVTVEHGRWLYRAVIEPDDWGQAMGPSRRNYSIVHAGTRQALDLRIDTKVKKLQKRLTDLQTHAARPRETWVVE